MASKHFSEKQEVYASDCCGALFMPGHGPDDITEVKTPRTHDAYRTQHECPGCGEGDPALKHVTDVYPPFDPEGYADSGETLWDWLMDFGSTVALACAGIYLFAKAMGGSNE